MRAYHQMPLRDFVDQIREIAINARAKPLVMDAIDALRDIPDQDQIEKDQEDAVALAEDELFERVIDEWEDGASKAIETVETMDIARNDRETIIELIESLKPSRA